MPSATPPFVFRSVFPRFRYVMGLGRRLYSAGIALSLLGRKRPASSVAVSDHYRVFDTSTIDGTLSLEATAGTFPTDIEGSLFLCQCLGSPEAFMVGDSNIVRLDFGSGKATLTNRLLWTPAALARQELAKTRFRFDFFGLMFLSPGVGLFSYAEGMYLMPDGRIAVTSDVDRPWLIERDTLRAVTPLGRRDEWLPMMAGEAGDAMGNLFAAYNNSHVTYTDTVTGEVLLVSWQGKQADGHHPVKVLRWNGRGALKGWLVVDAQGQEIEVKQSLHELAFTRDYIVLADTAFAAGMEMLTPWVNAPLPLPKTVVYLVDRRQLIEGVATVTAERMEIDQPCIHLIAEYDNPGQKITLYALHTPATNTAELVRAGDRDLDGKLFPDHLVGYGTLPVLAPSSIGKHVIDVASATVTSQFLTDERWTWGPYLYAFAGRQVEPFRGQDLFVMFKGFSRELLPRRIHDAYRTPDSAPLPTEPVSNSLCRISTADLTLADAYAFPAKTLCLTVACLDSTRPGSAGYVIAGVITDTTSPSSSAHEYWLFDAAKLAQGPLCRLTHPQLSNTTLFHSVYVPTATAQKWPTPGNGYRVPLRQDFPRDELKKWGPELEKAFDEAIWPIFDPVNGQEATLAEARVARLAAGRTPADRTDGTFGREHLIGEERTLNAELAERMVAEAERIWQTTGWKVESRKKGIRVESKPVSGPFEAAGVLLARADGLIDAPAQVVFDLLVSPEGFAILDPFSNPEDHNDLPLQTLAWRPGSRLEVATASMKMPGMAGADFVVLNAIDPVNRIFVSKSVLHDDRPGGSLYSSVGPQPGRTRALNTMAIKALELSEGRCRLLVLNYADLPGVAPPLVMNFINTKLFFAPLYRRIAKAVRG